MSEPLKLIIYTDGGSRGNPGPAAIGVHAEDQTGKNVFEISKTLGVATNNEAEYQAFRASVEWLLSFPDLETVSTIEWKLDSMLVVEQLRRNWKIKEPRLQIFAQEIWQLLEKLSCPWSIGHVRREFNKRADQLVNQALDET